MTVLVLMILSGFEFMFVEVFLLSTFTFGLILDCCLNLIPACKRSVLLIFEARILTPFFLFKCLASNNSSCLSRFELSMRIMSFI